MSAADTDALDDMARELGALAALCDDEDALAEAGIYAGQKANGAVRATPFAQPKPPNTTRLEKP